MLHALSCVLHSLLFHKFALFASYTQFFAIFSFASSKIGFVVSWFFLLLLLFSSFFAILFGFYAAHIVCSRDIVIDGWNTIDSM